MKQLLLFLAISCSASALMAQCPNPQSQIDIQGNNIQARILNGGDLFTSFYEGQFIPNPSSNNSPSTIFSAGLWTGGVDPAGNLKLATSTYRTNNSYDYTAGPLSADGMTDPFTCANWDRHFRITGAEIAAFQLALPLTPAQAIAQFPDIMGWPAKGNNTFSAIWGFDLPQTTQSLAAFFDANLDGQYRPLDGDYPVVKLQGKEPFVPAEIIWCVFNDQNSGGTHSNSNGKAIQAEIQLTVWALNCAEHPVLNNTVFTSHKIINRASETIDSTFFAIWVDFDLGCYLDDYVGSNRDLNTFFAYNQDAVDGQPGSTCSGTPTFGDAPPVQTVTFLNHPISKLMVINNSGFGSQPPGATDPNTPPEIYNYLTGSWRDGAPLTIGGNGYGGADPTDFIFPGDPSDPNAWSMCTANLPFGDRRMLASTKFGQLLPGQVEELNTAWTVHYNAPPPCNLGTAMTEIATLHSLYDSGLALNCSPVSKAPIPPADSIDLFPNPTNSDATLRYGAILVEEIRIFDATGKLLQTLANPGKGETILKMGQFPVGMYTLRLFTDEGNITKKLAVVK